MSRPVAVITGASRGIGKQLCIDMAGAGYDIVAVARSSKESPSRILPGTIDETIALARKAGGAELTAIPAALDVRNEAGVQELADRVFSEFGRCDVLVNNAAIAPPGDTLSLPTDLWRKAMDINVHGPLYFTYYFAPRMIAGASTIINISSSAAVAPEFRRASYTATKRALEALTECMAVELAGKVACNAIRLELSVWSEGYTSTLPEDDFSDMEDPVVMSDAVLWLCRQPLEYTGRVLTIGEMRELGAVRGVTRIGDRAES
ncbi:MAG TPA: SDR family oxidoreductase [Dehalococcoidia bacterium]|nr:SDR family oxidoreductase [Dehalococcoidia bacterium]